MGAKDKRYFEKIAFFDKIQRKLESHNKNCSFFKDHVSRIEITMYSGEKKIILKK